MNTNSVIWSKTLMPGDRWSGSIGKGKIIRFCLSFIIMPKI